jgi:hypothetical protein
VLKTVVSALTFHAYRLVNVFALFKGKAADRWQSPSPLPPPEQLKPVKLVSFAPDNVARAGVTARTKMPRTANEVIRRIPTWAMPTPP